MINFSHCYLRISAAVFYISLLHIVCVYVRVCVYSYGVTYECTSRIKYFFLYVINYISFFVSSLSAAPLKYSELNCSSSGTCHLLYKNVNCIWDLRSSSSLHVSTSLRSVFQSPKTNTSSRPSHDSSFNFSVFKSQFRWPFNDHRFDMLFPWLSHSESPSLSLKNKQ